MCSALDIVFWYIDATFIDYVCIVVTKSGHLLMVAVAVQCIIIRSCHDHSTLAVSLAISDMMAPHYQHNIIQTNVRTFQHTSRVHVPVSVAC